MTAIVYGLSIITLDAGQSDSRQETVQPVNKNKHIYLINLGTVLVKFRYT